MKISGIKRPTISKITMGTVQLGMDYGIANKHGKPKKEESWDLLQYTLDSGITSLDTARHYGSEEVIGQSGLSEKFTVISKFKLEEEYLYDPQTALDAARVSVLKSCEDLKLKKLQICLFHQNMKHPIGVVAEVLPFILTRLKEENLIEMGGLSAFYPDELNAITDWSVIEAVQVPMNVFDQRLLKDGLLEKLKQNHVTVFVRSVFLQGLLLMDPEFLPAHLSEARPYLILLHDLAAAEGLSVAQLAFSYVRDTEGVTSLVIGAENKEQMIQNVALLKGPGLSAQARSSIADLFSEMPETLITPALWAS